MAGEAVRAVLKHVWSALEPLEFPCALMGGAALAAWHHPRATRDVDLLIGVHVAQVDLVIEQLKSAGCRTKNTPPIVTLGALHLVQFLYTPPDEFYDAQFDLWLADTELQKSALGRRVRREVPGIDSAIYVLNCDDLILFKLAAGRMIDLADTAILLRENRESLDLSYLADWIERLDLERTFREIWEEAFPGEELPDAFDQ